MFRIQPDHFVTFEKRFRIRGCPGAQNSVNVTVNAERRYEQIKFVFRKIRTMFLRHIRQKDKFPVIKNDKAGSKTR